MVVLVGEARYGRMKVGRCVEYHMGNINCYSDVTRLLDQRCSARSTCQIRVPDAEMERTRPCLKELKTYLEVKYSCITVTSISPSSCHHDIRPSSSQGYFLLSPSSSSSSSSFSSHSLSSFSLPSSPPSSPSSPSIGSQKGSFSIISPSSSSSSSSSSCTVSLSALPGQHISLSLFSLGGHFKSPLHHYRPHSVTSLLHSPHAPKCPSLVGWYSEGSDDVRKVICGDVRGRRVENVLERSKGHLVKIWVDVGDDNDDVDKNKNTNDDDDDDNDVGGDDNDDKISKHKWYISNVNNINNENNNNKNNNKARHHNATDNKSAFYIIKFKVHGCPNLTSSYPPSYLSSSSSSSFSSSSSSSSSSSFFSSSFSSSSSSPLKLEDNFFYEVSDDGSNMKVGCSERDWRWVLRCSYESNTWVGEVGNCSEYFNDAHGQTKRHDTKNTEDLSIPYGLAISSGAVVGVLIAFIIIIIITCKRSTKTHRDRPETLKTEDSYFPAKCSCFFDYPLQQPQFQQSCEFFQQNPRFSQQIHNNDSIYVRQKELQQQNLEKTSLLSQHKDYHQQQLCKDYQQQQLCKDYQHLQQKDYSPQQYREQKIQEYPQQYQQIQQHKLLDYQQQQHFLNKQQQTQNIFNKQQLLLDQMDVEKPEHYQALPTSKVINSQC